ncbi:hypothetical protein ACHAXS_014063 [Conticribra weissflogii]
MATASMEQAVPTSLSNQLNAHIASGCFTADGMQMKITKRRNALQNIQDDSEIGLASHDDKEKVDGDDDDVEPITLPESTHSLLFSEPICSLGFLFAAFIVVLSYASLLLALVNNFTDGTADNPLNIPYNVTYDVRISQYLAIVIALIMEEEIPTSLYLLRMIPKQSLHKKFPNIKFYRFFLAAMVRLLMGYLFLTNTFLVVVQAEEVLDIFYDVLALQFLQQLGEETDCNYHGQCVEGACVCNGDGWFGVRCQHQKPCKRIVGREGAQWILGIVDEKTIYRTYDLPLYVYDSGLNSTIATRQNVTSEDMIALMFSGSRWFGTVQKGKKNETKEYWIEYSREFHSFWDRSYSELTRFVSDPTTKSSPIAVDFYEIGERGYQYGPFGQLFPLSYPEGSGYFICDDTYNVTIPVL